MHLNGLRHKCLPHEKPHLFDTVEFTTSPCSAQTFNGIGNILIMEFRDDFLESICIEKSIR